MYIRIRPSLSVVVRQRQQMEAVIQVPLMQPLVVRPLVLHYPAHHNLQVFVSRLLPVMVEMELIVTDAV